MSKYATWYTDAAGSALVVVVPPQQLPAAHDEVLAHALAWQHDLDLVLVVPNDAADAFLARLPWIATPCRVLGYGADLRPAPLPVPARDQVHAAYAALAPRTVTEHAIPEHQRAWVAELLDDPALFGTSEVPTASYVSWHHHGLQVLRLTSSRRGLRVAAGVQHSRRQAGPPHTNELLTGRLSSDQLKAAVRVIAHDRGPNGEGRSQTSDQSEHRLQAKLAAQSPPPLGLRSLRREFPGWRGPDRPGYIDFLGIDADGHLHVVETKIGHDPRVLLQALDYATWVHAHQDTIRRALGWPAAPPAAQVHLDLVLAAKIDADGDVKEPAVNPYLAGQLEALCGDLRWRLFTIADPDAEDIDLQQLPRVDLWDPAPGRTAKPVRPPRWAARVEAALRTPTQTPGQTR